MGSERRERETGRQNHQVNERILQRVRRMEQSTKREREQAKSMSSYSWRERQKGVTRPGPEPVREKKSSTLRRLHPE